tara:strand:+ start:2846 stop:3844 length:999 start_codon:yes stop_codon:yes gene_type:complete
MLSDKKIMMLHWTGRFGNRMFQYAFGCQYAKTYNVKFYIPSEWEGHKLFKPNKYVEIIPDDELRLYLNQTKKEMDNVDFRKYALNKYKERTGDTVTFIITNQKNDMGKTNIAFDDLSCMYFPHIFEMLDIEFLKTEVFVFKDEITELPLYKEIKNAQNKYDVVHWRRGDIASPAYNGAHSLVSKRSIDEAVMRYQEELNLPIVYVSDDAKYKTKKIECIDLQKWYAKSTGHAWTYPTGEHAKPEIVFDWLPEFLVIMHARVIFRGNSAFSWWASFFAQITYNNELIYAPIVRTKPNERKEKFWEMDSAFIKGNYPHFMGSKEEGFYDIHLKW